MAGNVTKFLVDCMFYPSSLRRSYNGNTLAFQARAAGSIPARRSIFKEPRAEIQGSSDCF